MEKGISSNKHVENVASPSSSDSEFIYLYILIDMQLWVIRSQIVGKNFDLSTHCQ